MEHNPIDTYHRKLAEARKALAGTFIALATGKDVRGEYHGFIICGSAQDIDPTEFNNFVSYSVGRSEADIREVDDSLVFWDAEERSEHSDDGEDYHAIVAGKALADCLRESARDAANPAALAVETVLIDAPENLFVLLYLSRVPQLSGAGCGRRSDVTVSTA